MGNCREITLGLFFTRGVSLEQWLERGLFDREKLIYERFLMDGSLSNVYWFTYGPRDGDLAKDLYIAGKLDYRIKLLSMPKFFALYKIGVWIYSILLPFVHWRFIKRTDILKTNQLDGAWTAVAAKFIFKKPLIVRCGYVQSKLEKSLKRVSWLRIKIMLWGENVAYKMADASIVTSRQNQRYVLDNYKLPVQNLYMIPNYIDIHTFAPRYNRKLNMNTDRLLYIGRLSKEKNLINLIAAAQSLGVGVDMIGDGPLGEELRHFSLEIGANLKLFGAVPNSDLPEILVRYKYFVLPSLYEGMPKSLIEAMACGLVCIGTDVDGINEIVKDGINGILAKGTDTESLISALKKSQEVDGIKLAIEARKTVMRNYTLNVCASMEYKIIASLVSKDKSLGLGYEG